MTLIAIAQRDNREAIMSREEAASVYLDNLLGFHGNYRRFQQADRVLTEEEKRLLHSAVTGWAKDDILSKSG